MMTIKSVRESAREYAGLLPGILEAMKKPREQWDEWAALLAGEEARRSLIWAADTDSLALDWQENGRHVVDIRGRLPEDYKNEPEDYRRSLIAGAVAECLYEAAAYEALAAL